jgi:hypothetical protein
MKLVWSFANGGSTNDSYAMQWLFVLPLEVIAGALTIQYWNAGLSKAIFITIFLFAIVAINLCGIKTYGEAEFLFSTVKVTAIVGFMQVAPFLLFLKHGRSSTLTRPSMRKQFAWHCHKHWRHASRRLHWRHLLAGPRPNQQRIQGVLQRAGHILIRLFWHRNSWPCRGRDGKPAKVAAQRHQAGVLENHNLLHCLPRRRRTACPV